MKTEVIVWLITALVLLGIEALSVQLVSIWFAIGAMVTMIACAIFPVDVTVQLLIFVASSGILLLCTRSFVKKVLNKNTEKTNVDSLVGKTAVIDEPVDNLQGAGSLKLEGKIWSVRSADDRTIPAGTLVEVMEIRGVKLIVKELSAVPTGE